MKQGTEDGVQKAEKLMPTSKKNMRKVYSLLHRACCWVNQLLYQLLHIYKIYKIYTLKY